MLEIPFSEEFSNFIKEVKKRAMLLFLGKKEFTSSKLITFLLKKLLV